MIKTSNLNVRNITAVISPDELRRVFPQSEKASTFIKDSRSAIRDILLGRDRRLVVVVGPCSIHDPKAALEYAGRLSLLSRELSDRLFIMMRVYFEKPRTTRGWKGLINDPEMNGTHLISKGLGMARNLLMEITDLRLPVACEMLDPITPDYLSDFISWGAIGARTSESQIHREMASGLSFPVGFKNSTDGNLQIAIDAMKSALYPHRFLGIDHDGRTSVIQTAGNPDVHMVLRGGRKPNYFPECIKQAQEILEKSNLIPSVMVDCSHGNSEKRYENQPMVLESTIDQIVAGNPSIFGVMIESNIAAGNQPIPADLSELKYGVSITDECLDWEGTEEILRMAHERLKSCDGPVIYYEYASGEKLII